MIDSIYQFLANIGYSHPLHPTLTHVPIGMIIGAFLFALTGLVFRNSRLARTARHCIVLALIALVPTALLGMLDWQHFYGGPLLFPIKMKVVLAAVVLFLLIVAVVFGAMGERFARAVLAVYLLCLLGAVGLGYFGGELVYGTRAPAVTAVQGAAVEGALVFQQNCSACHFADSTAVKIGPGLKGLFQQDKLPISGRTVSAENLRQVLKTPVAKMPPFGHLSQQQVAALIAYLKTL